MRKLTSYAFALLCVFNSFAANAGLDEGVVWLKAQQIAGGSLPTASKPLSTHWQATAEAASALLAIDGQGSVEGIKAISFLNTDVVEETTASLSQKIIFKKALDETHADLLANLLPLQNKDGGFGDQKGYASSAYDTAIAIQALKSVSYTGSSVLQKAIGYLAAVQQADGGFSVYFKTYSKAYVTAEVIQALYLYRFTFDVNATLEKGRNYLLGQRNAEGSWGAHWETAKILISLLPNITNVEPYQALIDSVTSAQLNDGSWNNDVYATATVLKLLNSLKTKATGEVPTSTDKGRVTGSVVNASSGIGIINADIFLYQNNTVVASTKSGADGQYTLNDVMPGSYSLRPNIAGFNTTGVSIDLTVVASQTSALPKIELVQPSSLSILSGTITAKNSGAAIPSVDIKLTKGSDNFSATSDDVGNYSLAVNPGSYTLTASALGYHGTSLQVELKAGEINYFSPAMVLSSEAAPQNLPISITGQVRSKASSEVISGVVATVLGTNAAVNSDQDGIFALAGLTAGSIQLSLKHPDYLETTINITASPGSNVDLGEVTLVLKSNVESSIAGTVVNSDGGALLEGVSFKLSNAQDSYTATSDVNGAYKLVVPEGSYIALVEKFGFHAISLPITVPVATNIQFSPLLIASDQPDTTNQNLTLKGFIKDFTSKDPIVGASVSIKGKASSATLSGSDGSFILTDVSAGELQIDLQHSTYTNQSYVLVASGAGEVSVGELLLGEPEPAKATNIVGKVLDSLNNTPVSGAVVLIPDFNMRTVANALGEYAFTNLEKEEFDIEVSAAGYIPSSFKVKLSGTGVASLDVKVQRIVDSGVEIVEIQLPMGSRFEAYGEVEVAAFIKNTNLDEKQVRMYLKIVDSTGKVIEQFPHRLIPVGGDPLNALVPLVSQDVSETEVEWNFSGVAPDQYTVIVQVFDGFTNVLLAERGATIEILPTKKIGGGVQFDPPIAQLASKKPISIVANIANVGNLPINATTLSANVRLKRKGFRPPIDEVEMQTLISGSELTNFVNVDHYERGPDGGLYFTQGGNVYVINNKTDIEVFLNLRQAPYSMPNTTDLKFSDDGHLHILGANKIMELNGKNIISVKPINLTFAVNNFLIKDDSHYILSTYFGVYRYNRLTGEVAEIVGKGIAGIADLVIGSDEAIYIANSGIDEISVFSNGKLKKLIDLPSTATDIAIGPDDTLYVISNESGNIYKITMGSTPELTVIGSGFNGASSISMAPGGELFITSSLDNSVYSLSQLGEKRLIRSWAVSQPIDLMVGQSQEKWFLDRSNNSVVKVHQDGRKEVISGISGRVDKIVYSEIDSLVYVLTNARDIYRIDASNRALKINTTLPLNSIRDISVSASGNIIVSVYNTHKIYSVQPTGETSLLAQSWIGNAKGVVSLPAGDFYVDQQGLSINVVKVDKQGKASYVAEGIPSSGDDLKIYDDNHLVHNDTSGRRVLKVAIDTGNVEVLANTGSIVPQYISVTPAKHVLFSSSSSSKIYKIESDGSYSEYMDLSQGNIAGDFYSPVDGIVWYFTSSSKLAYQGINGNSFSAGNTLFNVRKILKATDSEVWYSSRDGIRSLSVSEETSTVLAFNEPTSNIPIDVSFVGDVGVFLYRNGEVAKYSITGEKQSHFQALKWPVSAVELGGKLYVAGFNSVSAINGTDNLPSLIDRGISYSGMKYKSGNELLLYTSSQVETLNILTASKGEKIQSNSISSVFYKDNKTYVVSLAKAYLKIYSNNTLLLESDYFLKQPKNILMVNTETAVVSDSQRAGVLNINTGVVRVFPNKNFDDFDIHGGKVIGKSGGRLYELNINDITFSLLPGSLDGVTRKMAIAKSGLNSVFTGVNNLTEQNYLEGGSEIKSYGLSIVSDIEYMDGKVYVASGASLMSIDPEGSLSLLDSHKGSSIRQLDLVGSRLFVYLEHRLISYENDTKQSDVYLGKSAPRLNALFMLENNEFWASSGLSKSFFSIKINDGEASYSEGEVIYSTTYNLPPKDVMGGTTLVDLGSWTPEESGIYEVTVSSPDVGGVLKNTLSIGATAQSILSLNEYQLLSGDQSVDVLISVDGLNPLQITKMDVDNSYSTGQVQATGPFNALALGVSSDSKGNFYLSRDNNVWKVSPNGEASILVDDLDAAVQPGMDVDSSDNVYVVTRNSITKIAPDGNVEKIIEKSGLLYLYIDKDDNIFVSYDGGSIGKVLVDGQLQHVITLDGHARNISGDIYGNLYVQSFTSIKSPDGNSASANIISKVFPDGRTSVLFEGASFEQEGTNSTIDCSNNLLFAPIDLPSIPYRPGEENAVFQYSGNASSLRMLLGPSDLKVTSRAIDIDLIQYDNLNNRLLLVNHNWNEILSIPMTCGGIDVSVNLISRPDVNLSGFDMPPSMVINLDGGRKKYTWNLSDVTQQGVTLKSGALFSDLEKGETRSLLSGAYLEYSNSFALEDKIQVPIDIPSISVLSSQALVLSTDKPTYAADEDVVISLDIENRSDTAFNGSVELKIVDSAGIEVQKLAPLNVTNVLKDTPAQLTTRWNTGLTYSADYRVEATLLDEQSTDAGQAEADFTITPAGLDNSLANVSLLVNKLSYNAWDSVQLTGRLRNLASNSILPESVSTLVVKNPDGSSFHNASATSNELISKSFKDMFFNLDLVDASAGQFTAELTSRDKSSNAILAADTAIFTVARSAFAGLVGKVQATPQVIYSGQNTQCQFSTENNSAIDFDDIDLRYQVVSLQPESVITEENEKVQILGQSERNNTIAVNAKNFAVGRFACLLKTIVGGQEQNLAAAIFEVREPARIQITPATLSIAEQGGTGTIAIALSARPQNDVTITLTSNAEVNLQSSSLIFNSANWNQAQSVVVTAVDDLIDRNDIASITVAVNKAISDTAYANTPDVEVAVTIQDNDQAGLLIDQTAVTIAEPSSQAPLQLQLNSQPVGSVIVALASASTADALVSPSHITFTPANWNQPQTVMVSAVDDLIDRNDTTRITASISSAVDDLAYKTVAPKVIPVTIIDNDVAALSVSPQAIRIAENAGQGSITVSLQTQPTADVFISLATADTTEVSLARSSLQFTPANWNVAQAVVVTAINDDYDRDDSALIKVSVAANTVDAAYQSVPSSNVTITIDDDDLAGLNVPAAALTLAESAGTTTVPVSLSARPTGTVVLAVSSDNTAEMTVSPTTLQFDASNWSTVQNITVTAVDDAIDRDDSAQLTVALQSSVDIAFQGLAAHSIDVNITDDDIAAWIVDPVSVSVDEKAGTVTASVKLASEPTAPVLVDVKSSDSSEVTVAASQLSFNAGNWQQVQTIIITAVDDAVARDDSASISLQATSTTADLNYRNLAAAQVAVTINNDDQPGVTLSATSFTIPEQAGKASLGIQLNSQPEAEVVLSITADNQEVELATQQLRFTAANWNQSQAVQITAVDDSIDRNDSAVVSVAIASDNQDVKYTGIASQDVAITITNDDSASFALSTTVLTVDEQAGTATFTAVLGSQPEGAVQLSVISEDTAEASVTPSSISFNELNWNQPQTVTVTGVDDLIDRNDAVNLNVKVSTAPQDAVYQSLATQQVKVTLTDNDESSISIEPGALSIGENAGTGQLIVRLASQPAQLVNLTVNSADEAEATVSLPELNFTADNWDSGLTVTVTGVNDNTLDNDSTTIVFKAKADSDASYSALAQQDIPVTLVNDDILKIAGIVSVASNPIQQGSAQVCDFSVNNEGTIDQPTLLIWKELLRSDGTAVHSTRQTLNLAAGASTTISESFTTTGLAEGTYRCALSAQLNSQKESLATANFALETATIRLETKLDLVQQGRVLILMDEGQPTCTATTSVTLEGHFHKPVGNWSTVYAKAFQHHSLLDYEVGEPGEFTGTINNNGYYSNVDVSITDLSQQHIRMKVDAEDVFQGRLKFYSYYEYKRRLKHINTGTVHFECGKPAQVGDKWGQFTVTAVETRELIISEEDEAHCPSQSSGHHNGYGHGHYHHGNGYGHDRHDEPAENPTVESQRSYLEALLNTAGISHTIVDSIDDFRAELRSGLYNQYLVTAERLALDKKLARELREAVHRGEGLIMASGSDLEPEALFDTLGLEYPRWKGGWHKGWHQESDYHWGHGWKSKWTYGWHHRSNWKHSELVRSHSMGSGIVLSNSEVSAAAQADFALQRDILDVNTDGAQTVGTLVDATPSFDYQGELPERDYPVVSVHSYGDGHAAYIGFDLLAEATLGQGSSAGSVYQSLILGSLGYAVPENINTRAGAAVPLQLDLRNLGKHIAGNSQFSFSENTQMIDAMAAVEQAPGYNWGFDLTEEQSSHITLWLQPEYHQGQAWAEAVIRIDQNGAQQDYEVLRKDILETVNAGESIEAICDDIAAQHDADGYSWRALTYLHKAHKKMEYGRHDYALQYLLEVADALRQSNSAASPAIRKDVDWLIWQVSRQAGVEMDNEHDYHSGHGSHHGNGHGNSHSNWWN